MIPFIDLQAQRKRLGQPLEDAILKVVRSGAYIMGPEIAELERQLCAFGQAPFALSCGSGTEVMRSFQSSPSAAAVRRPTSCSSASGARVTPRAASVTGATKLMKAAVPSGCGFA